MLHLIPFPFKTLKILADMCSRILTLVKSVNSALALQDKQDKVLLKELALGCAGISNDADVDVSSQRCALHGGFRNTSKQHEQNPPLYLIIT